MNDNGRKLIELCKEKKLSVENTFSEKRETHKFTWVSEVDVYKRILDLILVEEEERNKLLDVNVLRGAVRGILDHHLVVAKIRCLES